MGYTAFDHFVAHWRYQAALPHVSRGSRICDIGCGAEAGFLTFAQGTAAWGIGLDYHLPAGSAVLHPLVQADVMRGLPLQSGTFDHAVMLAVLEHLPQPKYVLAEVFRILVPGGTLIMTWPVQAVDPILALLRRLRLISSDVETEKHVRRFPLAGLLGLLRDIGFDGFTHRRFEWGLNNLLVARKPGEHAAR